MRILRMLAATIAAGWILVCAPLSAQTVPISQFPSASALGGNEKLAAAQGSGCAAHTSPCANVAVTPAQIGTYLAATFQPVDAQLTAWAALSPAADKCTYWTGSTAAALYDCPSFGRSLVAASSASAARTTLQAPRLASYASGYTFLPDGVILGTSSPVAPGADSLRLLPGWVRDTITVTSLGIRVTTAAASGNCRNAVYASSSTTLRPTGAPVITGAAQSTTATGTKEDATVSVALTPGLYWWGTLCDTSAATAIMMSVNAASYAALVNVGAPSLASALSGNGTSMTGYSKAQTYASGFPTLTGNETTDSLVAVTTTSIPVVAFKVQ